jgi:hypothetical protein
VRAALWLLAPLPGGIPSLELPKFIGAPCESLPEITTMCRLQAREQLRMFPVLLRGDSRLRRPFIFGGCRNDVVDIGAVASKMGRLLESGGCRCSRN